MDCGLGFLGEYITAAELVGKTPTLTINKVTLEKVESLKGGDDDAAGKMKDKIVIYFAESKSGRGWLLNRTNAEAIKEMWGRETNDWLGHKITLFTQQVKVGKKMEPGIRVKGSPELTAPRQFELKLPRKKAVMVTLLPTAKQAPAPDAGPAEQALYESTRDKLPTATTQDVLDMLMDDVKELTDAHKAELAPAIKAAVERVSQEPAEAGL